MTPNEMNAVVTSMMRQGERFIGFTLNQGGKYWWGIIKRAIADKAVRLALAKYGDGTLPNGQFQGWMWPVKVPLEFTEGTIVAEVLEAQKNLDEEQVKFLARVTTSEASK